MKKLLQSFTALGIGTMLFISCDCSVKNQPDPTPDPNPAPNPGGIEVPTPPAIIEEPTLTIEPLASDFMLPYLRWWDDLETLKEFEGGRGSKISYEESTGPGAAQLVFDTKSPMFPKISYMAGDAYPQAVAYAKDESVFKNPKFLPFLKHYGFEPNGEEKDGIWKFESKIYTTASLTAYTKDLKYGESTFGKGLYFLSVQPKLNEIPLPFMNWDATPEHVKKYEESRAFVTMNKVKINDHVEGYPFSYKKELLMYTKLYAPRYEFKDGKLARITLWLVPDAYVYRRVGDGVWQTNPEFDSIAKKYGYSKEKSKQNGINKDVYLNKEKGNKFTIEMYSINVNGKVTPAAALAFVPYDGPDVIEWEQ